MGMFKKKEKDSPIITLDKAKSITITGTMITDEEKLITSTLSNSNIAVAKVEFAEEHPAAEWVWIEGYKGTDKDMKCRNDFQFTLGEEYTKDGEIIMCENGFHFSPTLKQTFEFYLPTNGNRFFKVKALINKNQLVKKEYPVFISWVGNHHTEEPKYEMVPMKLTDSKLVAKSIILLEEIGADEIIKTLHGENSQYCNASNEFKKDLLIGGPEYAERNRYKSIIQNSMVYGYELKRFAKNCNNTATLRKIAILGSEDMNNETRMQMIFDNKYNI